MDREEELKEKIRTMEVSLLKNEKIRKVLMERVEKSINSSGSAYTLFENNITLQDKVNRRTEALRKANRNLLIEIENRKRAEKEKQTLIEDLQKALAEVQVLSGMLPICSYCKKIRNDKGYWQAIETYIRDHSTAEFSHGICNDCMREQYPDLYEKFMKEVKLS